MSAAIPFVGRSSALRRLDDVIEPARRGHARALVVTGAPGAGKSRLLTHWSAGLGDGITILRMSGHESEQHLPFAGLHQLLTPIAARLDGLTDPRRSAMKAAMALGSPPVATERFAVASALHEIVTSLADERPVAITVDDAQWLDESSMQALIFTVRRLDADRVGVIIAVRPGDHVPLEGLPVLDLGPVSDEAAREIVAAAHPDVIPSVVGEIVSTANGLPLALLEIPQNLSPAQCTGTEPLDRLLPAGTTLERAYRRRIADLDERARDALLVACLEETNAERLTIALRALALNVADLEPAERVGLIRVSASGVEFAHPLARSAIVHAAPAAARTRARRALAEVFDDDPSRRAWHLDAIAGGPDEPTAAALELAAATSATRGAYAESGHAAEAAAGRSPNPDDRCRRLGVASDMYTRAGVGVPLKRVLRELVDGAHEPAERARWTAHEISTVPWLDGTERPDTARLIDLADAAARTDVDVAVRLLLSAGATLVASGHGRQAAELRLAAQRLRPPRHGDIRSRLVDDLIAVFTGCDGGNVLRSDWPADLSDEEMRDHGLPIVKLAFLLGLIGETERASAALNRHRALLERAGALEQLGITRGILAFIRQRGGDWTGAEADFAAAVKLCADTDLLGSLPYVRVGYAGLLSARGDEGARDLLAEAVGGTTAPSVRHLAECALGLLDAGTGRYESAVQHLLAAGELEREHCIHEPAYSTRPADLVEALWRLRRPDDAVAELDDFEDRAKRARRPIALALAARCRALLVPVADVDAAFGRALDHHAADPVPFEEARTRLCWGERLRRARRKADARVQLRAALDVFDRLGATAWADRARAELAACGERRGVVAGVAAELTPQELQVAVAVARGASNPQVAGALCISRRTVEYHLNSVYRKLGVLDRKALAERLSGTASPLP